jgi:transposase
MSVRLRAEYTIPTETARVARAAFPKGTALMTLRDELGEIYADRVFADLFPRVGQPAQAPGCLALVTVLQFSEELTDREAADAVRSRLDWKYLLGLELTDPGFDFSVLSEFRQRLLAGGAEERLLEDFLTRLKAKGLVKAGGTQRTDGTHVLDAVRTLNRLELVGETLRHALNDLAAVVPEWLQTHVTPDWYERYGRRLEAGRLPRTEADRQALALTIGRDGDQLYAHLAQDLATAVLCAAPAVEALRQIWLQNYYRQDGEVRWRTADQLPPAAVLLQSPYDLETHYSTKGEMHWTGYKVHLTETCAPEAPHIITHVETTLANVRDFEILETVHRALAVQHLLPAVHLVDAAYPTATLLLTSSTEYGLRLVARVSPDHSWQAQHHPEFTVANFQIEWDQQQVTCPQGQRSTLWSPHTAPGKPAWVNIAFPAAACQACPVRPQCTRGAKGPRTLKLHARLEHEALQAARVRQTTPEFQTEYNPRAGIEGTLSQGVRKYKLRRSRYIGLAKTHLQHVATAVAINWTRFVAWTDHAIVTRPAARFAQLGISAAAH